MKIAIIKPNSVNMDPWVPELQRRGHEVLVNDLSEDTDFMIGASVSVMSRISNLRKKFPNVPMINYNWDVYEWVWTHPRGRSYDWKGYGDLLRDSLEVWCPSESVVLRNKEWYDIPREKSFILKTFVRLFESDSVSDERFVLNPLRQIPDRNHGWFEKACEELNIPYKSSDHSLSEEEFKKVVSTCSFMVCPWYEASTGGLTLIEGYALGKPVLVSSSPYMGAADYFGDRAEYFKEGDYEDFKARIKQLWDDTPVLDPKDCREFVEQYTIESMIDKMEARLEELRR